MAAPEATTTKVEASSSEVECVVTSLSESVLGSERGTAKHKNMVRPSWLAWSFQANFMFEPIL